MVGSHYFATTGTRLWQGRDFAERDRKGSQPVAIVNQAFAQWAWPSGSPLGKCIQRVRTCYTVIGVAANAKYARLDEQQQKALFVSLAQVPEQRHHLLIRTTTADPNAAIPAVRRALQQLAPNLPYIEVQSLTDMLRPVFQPRRLGASMFSMFGLLALLLAAVGLYGVVSYTVTQRTREMGVRIALGAQSSDVMRLVVWQGALLTIIGLTLGIGGALAASHLITHLLFGVSATDPITFAGVCVVLAAVALLASYLPARRAMRVDPVIALRAE
jgi:predicted permease